jgi:hypothetical protein
MLRWFMTESKKNREEELDLDGVNETSRKSHLARRIRLAR